MVLKLGAPQFEYQILVSGKRIILKVNGKTTVDYTEPVNPKRPDSWEDRILSHGLIAVQAHDPNKHGVLSEDPREGATGFSNDSEWIKTPVMAKG